MIFMERRDKEQGKIDGERAAWRKFVKEVRIKINIKKPRYQTRSKEYKRAWNNQNQKIIRMLKMQLLLDKMFKTKRTKRFWKELVRLNLMAKEE